MKNVLRDPLRRHGALLLVLAIGAGLRFANLGLIRHGYDASHPIYDALRILVGHEFPLLGQPSSVFLDNPPLMGYLQALPLLLWRSPWAVYLFVIALNTLAIAFVYRVAQALLGNAVAFFAALLFAINPWLIVYSRWSWVQGLLPFFMALIAWSLWPALVDRSRSPWRLIVAAVGLGAAHDDVHSSVGRAGAHRTAADRLSAQSHAASRLDRRGHRRPRLRDLRGGPDSELGDERT